MSRKDRSKSITPDQAALRMLASFLATLLLSGILIFGGAGQLNWTLGWFFLTAWTAPKLGFLILLRLLDPDLLIERATRHKNTQRYDRIILSIYFVFAFCTFIVGSPTADGRVLQQSAGVFHCCQPGWRSFLLVWSRFLHMDCSGIHHLHPGRQLGRPGD